MNENHFATTYAEKRQFDRFPLQLRVYYSAQTAPSNLTMLTESISRDLGLGGIAIIVDEKLETGQTLSVNIELPHIEDIFSENTESMSAAAKSVTLLSRVVWCKPAEEGNYLAGIQFLDLEQADAVELKEFLVEYKLRDSNLNQAS